MKSNYPGQSFAGQPELQHFFRNLAKTTAALDVTSEQLINDVEDQGDQIASLSNGVQLISNDLANFHVDFDNLENDVTAAELAIVNLTASLSETNNNLDSLESSVTSQINAITSDIDVIELINTSQSSDIVVINSLLSLTQGDVASHDDRITALESGGGGSGSVGSIVITAQATGTVPVVIGHIILDAADYAAPSAILGCPIGSDTATLKLFDGTTEVISVENSGSPTWVTAASGFTLSVQTDIELRLSADSVSATAVIYGISLELA